MRLRCLLRECAKDPKAALADFLRTPLARLRYGRAVIYAGDCYYLPYYRVSLAPPKGGPPLLFLGSALRDDVAVCRDDAVQWDERDCPPSHILEPRKPPLEIRREIEKKIKMNRRLRRSFGAERVDAEAMELVYVREPSFLVQCREYRLFLVDPLTEKVDLRHLPLVEERFLENARASGKHSGC